MEQALSSVNVDWYSFKRQPKYPHRISAAVLRIWLTIGLCWWHFVWWHFVDKWVWETPTPIYLQKPLHPYIYRTPHTYISTISVAALPILASIGLCWWNSVDTWKPPHPYIYGNPHTHMSTETPTHVYLENDNINRSLCRTASLL